MVSPGAASRESSRWPNIGPAGILRPVPFPVPVPVPVPVKSTLDAPRSSSAALTVPEPGESEFTPGRAPSDGLTGIAGVTVRRGGRPARPARARGAAGPACEAGIPSGAVAATASATPSARGWTAPSMARVSPARPSRPRPVLQSAPYHLTARAPWSDKRLTGAYGHTWAAGPGSLASSAPRAREDGALSSCRLRRSSRRRRSPESAGCAPTPDAGARAWPRAAGRRMHRGRGRRRTSAPR
jgi:hypothetical protein